MIQEHPIVSVIIPCYNNGNLLTEMLECLRRQTLPAWEAIIVDDGSTDDTPVVIEASATADRRIRFYRRERLPKGSVTCRNIGFSQALGNYVLHLDADDLISDTCLEKRVRFMEEHPDTDYASFPAKAFTDAAHLPAFTDPGRTWGVGTDGVDLLPCFLRAEYAFSVWNNIYRRERIAHLPWDENVKIYTDFSFIVPIILGGLRHRFSGQREIDYFYRVNHGQGNMCSSFVSAEKCRSTVYLFSKTLDALAALSNYVRYRNDFARFILLHYERLLIAGNRENTQAYLAFCSRYYPAGFVRRMRLAEKMTTIAGSGKKQRAVLYIALATLFGYKRYRQILLGKFR